MGRIMGQARVLFRAAALSASVLFAGDAARRTARRSRAVPREASRASRWRECGRLRSRSAPRAGSRTSRTLNPTTSSAYRIDVATGALSAVAGSPFRAGTHPFSITIEPTGNFAYVANQFSNTVSAYRIDARPAR